MHHVSAGRRQSPLDNQPLERLLEFPLPTRSGLKMHRGQSLVLWSLCLLVLSLFVFMNLSLAHRTRERMRMQELADASAYNQAVITARYFNALSVINRAAAADGAALAGHHAGVAYASFVRSALFNVRTGISDIKGNFDGCCSNVLCRQRSCACGEARQIQTALDGLNDFRALNYPTPLWTSLDLAAAAKFYQMQRHARDLSSTSNRLKNAVEARGGLIDQTTTRVLETAAPGEVGSGKIRLPFEQQSPSSARFRPYERSMKVLGNQWLPREYAGTSAFGVERETANTDYGAKNKQMMSHDHTLVPAWSWPCWESGWSCATRETSG